MKMSMTCLFFALAVLQGCLTSGHSPRGTQPPTAPSAQTPQEVVVSLNRFYNDVQQHDCREIGSNLPRGHYYCSGIIIRATSDGDYLPWTHSPASIAKGAASFSWFRKDHHPTFLLNPSGFILRNAVEASQLNLPGFDAGFICLFPFDATTAGNPMHNGCINQFARPTPHQVHPQPTIPHHNAAFAWGSCEDIGITTLEQWIEFVGPTFGESNTGGQCSWNADSQSGWRNAIAAKAHYTNLYYYWNEFLMATVDDGYSLKDSISAVFLDAQNHAAGLVAAQNFLRKLNENDTYAPIVRMDLSADQPFSFHEEDQQVATP